MYICYTTDAWRTFAKLDHRFKVLSFTLREYLKLMMRMANYKLNNKTTYMYKLFLDFASQPIQKKNRHHGATCQLVDVIVVSSLSMTYIFLHPFNFMATPAENCGSADGVCSVTAQSMNLASSRVRLGFLYESLDLLIIRVSLTEIDTQCGETARGNTYTTWEPPETSRVQDASLMFCSSISHLHQVSICSALHTWR